MKANTPISEIMSTQVISITPEKTVKDVKEVFENKAIHHIPVVDNGKLVGIVSMSDFLRLSMGATLYEAGEAFDNESINSIIYDSLKVGEMMTKNPATIGPDNTVNDAADLFGLNMFHALPVVDGEKLVGIVSTYDLIKFLLRE